MRSLLSGNHKTSKKATFTTSEQLIAYLDGLDMEHVTTIYFVGAEIGVAPKNSNELMKIVRDRYGKKIHIVTNGVFPQGDMAKLVEDLSPEDITSVKISIDGIRSQTHDKIRGKTGSFDRAFANSRWLKSKGFSVSPQMTIMPGNFGEALDSIDFFRRAGFQDIAYHLMSLEGRNQTTKDHLDPVAWRSLVDKMISRNEELDNFDIKIPIIFLPKMN